MFIRPRMVSCAQRDDVRAQTLHSWRQTDWDGEVPGLDEWVFGWKLGWVAPNYAWSSTTRGVWPE
jgi:hypothetical protein